MSGKLTKEVLKHEGLVLSRIIVDCITMTTQRSTTVRMIAAVEQATSDVELPKVINAKTQLEYLYKVVRTTCSCLRTELVRGKGK